MKQKLFGSLLSSICLLVLVLSGISTTQAQSNVWTAEYFNNSTLSGAPIVTTTEASPNQNWQWNAPHVSIPNDFFSVRWTSTQNLAAATYQVTVKADDGVRVFINNIAVIDQWHQATGQTYSQQVSLGAGSYTFRVEYYEVQEIAFLEYAFTQVGQTIPPIPQPTATPPVITGPSAVVTAEFLNVRQMPNPSSAQITVISRGQTFPVVNENADGSWVQLNVNGTLGWVNSNFVSIQNVQPTATVTTGALNVRQMPDPFTGAVLTQITQGQTYPLVGKNTDSSWVQINVNGIVGWVNSDFVSTVNIASVPITSNTVPSPPNPTPVPPAPNNPSVQVTAYALNVRQAPSSVSTILTQVRQNEVYPIVGQNSNGSWLQINAKGIVGWVSSYYVRIINGGTMPTPNQPHTAIVTSYRLNVRQLPSINTPVLTIISQNQRYTVLAKTADSSWVQLDVNGTIGWVNRTYVTVTPDLNVPVQNYTASAEVATYFLNARTLPNPYTGQIITVIARGQTFAIVGRNADSSWILLDINGRRGWVNRSYMRVSDPNLLATLPILG